MISNLHIKNVALIEEMDVEFDRGFNIISGETGAGKTMVIDSLNFFLGGRPSKDFIRSGEKQAQVDGVIYINNRESIDLLKEAGIEADEDGSILLSRTLTDTGKSTCRINGRTVTTGMVREVASLLFDMHSQHEHHSLLSASRHIKLLDKLCGEPLELLKAELAVLIRSHKEITKKIADIRGDESDRAFKLDIYSFQVKEIEAANLKAGEEDALVSRIRVLSNAQTIMDLTKSALADLYDGEVSAIDKLADGKALIEQLSEQDEDCLPFTEALETVYVQLDDVIRDIRRYADTFELNPDELNKLQNRLELIYKLKRKYGRTVEDILGYYNETKEKLELLINSGDILKKLDEERIVYEEKIISLCKKISSSRKKEADTVRVQIEDTLKELGMKDAKFDIRIERKEDFASDGYDRVEFMISPNAGEEMKQLAQIASGGEISRVMLALKTVLADADSIETFVFDEIDTGVSGRTAQKVALKLSLIARRRQIICITHLPQIAAMADAHFLIEKRTAEGRTVTSVEQLDNKKIIIELARLIGGARITDVTLKAAEEMKKLAKC